MNEREVMNLINSIDDDLVDKKIDELFNEKGESVNMSSIKEKAMNKLNQKQFKKSKINIKVIIAAAAAAMLTFSTVYASEMSKVIQSLYNKSVVYSTVVDGDAYYLSEEIKLDDKFTLLNVSVSKGHLNMLVKPREKLGDKETETLINISAIPMNDERTRYTIGGYGYNSDGVMSLSFMNEVENNYDIVPFKDFKFTIGGASYDISLTKAESLKVDENMVVGKPENIAAVNDNTSKEMSANKVQNMPLVANVAGSAEINNGTVNIQLVAGFDEPDLKLTSIGEPDFSEFSYKFENSTNGILSSGTSSKTKPIVAYDKDNNPYTLNKSNNAVGRPITVFEATAKQGTDLTVKLPAICAGFEKEVANISLVIPKEGEVSINKELDFIVQKAIVKSVKRISEDTAVVEFELNTGNDKTISLIDIGAYSKDVIKAGTSIKGNTATITMTFDKNIEHADFEFSWPRYCIKGNWSIELGPVE